MSSSIAKAIASILRTWTLEALRSRLVTASWRVSCSGELAIQGTR